MCIEVNLMGKENISRTKRDIEYCCELKREIKRYSKMINPLGELDRLLRGLCDDSEIDVELPPERIAEIQNKINALKTEYEKLATELKDVILMNITDRKQIEVLKLRYAQSMTWEDVIAAMDFSSRSVYLFHSKALAILDEIRYKN